MYTYMYVYVTFLICILHPGLALLKRYHIASCNCRDNLIFHPLVQAMLLSSVCMPTFIATIANSIWTSYSYCLRLFVVVYKLILLMMCCYNVLHVITGFLCP